MTEQLWNISAVFGIVCAVVLVMCLLALFTGQTLRFLSRPGQTRDGLLSLEICRRISDTGRESLGGNIFVRVNGQGDVITFDFRKRAGPGGKVLYTAVEFQCPPCIPPVGVSYLKERLLPELLKIAQAIGEGFPTQGSVTPVFTVSE